MKLPVVSIAGVTFSYGNQTILDDISLDVYPGEVTALLGPNGAGKSTLLKTLTGEVPVNADISYFGRKATLWKPEELARHVGVLSQSSSLSFNFRVEELVRLGGINLSVGKASLDAIIRDTMKRTDVAHLAKRLYPAISGGEKQRVHLARVLTQLAQSHGKTLLLLDEPTAALDLSHQHNTLQIAREMAKSGASVVVVLHDLNLAAQYSDRLLMLDKGKLVADGAPHSVLTEMNVKQVYGWKVRVLMHPEHQFPYIISH